MNPNAEDRPSSIPWPPIIYAVALAGAWLLESWLPLPALPENLLVRWFGAVQSFCPVSASVLWA